LVGIEACLQQLTAVDAEKRKAGAMDDYDMKKLARDFKQSFGALSALMTAKEGEVQSKGTDSAGKSVPQLSKPPEKTATDIPHRSTAKALKRRTRRKNLQLRINQPSLMIPNIPVTAAEPWNPSPKKVPRNYWSRS